MCTYIYMYRVIQKSRYPWITRQGCISEKNVTWKSFRISPWLSDGDLDHDLDLDLDGHIVVKWIFSNVTLFFYRGFGNKRKYYVEIWPLTMTLTMTLMVKSLSSAFFQMWSYLFIADLERGENFTSKYDPWLLPWPWPWWLNRGQVHFFKCDPNFL